MDVSGLPLNRLKVFEEVAKDYGLTPDERTFFLEVIQRSYEAFKRAEERIVRMADLADGVLCGKSAMRQLAEELRGQAGEEVDDSTLSRLGKLPRMELVRDAINEYALRLGKIEL